MAWEAVSKVEVAKLAGINTTELQDWWYNVAVDLIARHTRYTNIGTLVSVTEVRDGNDAARIAVAKPPIYSVTSVSVNGTVYSSDTYTFDSVSISFKNLLSDYTGYDRSFVFTRGTKNVVIAYTSGSIVVDQSVALAIALIIKELANTSSGEGAESRIQYYRPGESAATEAPLTQWGIHGKIVGVVKTILGDKVKIG